MKINDLLKELRTENNFTRKIVSEKTGYTIDYIKKLEQKDISPSEQVLKKLSVIYNCNLVKYNLILKEFNSINSYHIVKDLRWYISIQSINDIEQILLSISDYSDFLSGEPKQLLIYANALVQSVKYKNFIEAKSLCLEGLKVDVPNFQVTEIDKTLFSDTSYSLLICLSAQFLLLNDYSSSKIITKAIYNNFTNIVFNKKINLDYNSLYLKKIHIVTINNLADIYFRENKYQVSLALCDKGIDLSNKYETNNIIEFLYKLKVENLNLLNKFDDAQKTYYLFKYSCIMKNNFDLLKNTNIKFQTEYPNINTLN